MLSISPAEPARPLGEHGLRLWAQTTADYSLTDLGLEVLCEACQALDRAESMRAQIDRDGELIETPRGPKEHPLLKHELAARAFSVRTLYKLLPAEARPVGRPNVNTVIKRWE